MKKALLYFLILIQCSVIIAQERVPLTIDDLAKWNRISERVISDDGTLTAFRTEPTIGDPVVTLYDGKAELKATFNCATGINITVDSRFMIFTIKPPVEKVKELKLKKTKKEDMPLDMLAIHDITGGVTDTIMRLKGYKVPAKWSGWLAWQCEPVKEKPAASKDTTGNGKEAVKENE